MSSGSGVVLGILQSLFRAHAVNIEMTKHEMLTKCQFPQGPSLALSVPAPISCAELGEQRCLDNDGLMVNDLCANASRRSVSYWRPRVSGIDAWASWKPDMGKGFEHKNEDGDVKGNRLVDNSVGKNLG